MADIPKVNVPTNTTEIGKGISTLVSLTVDGLAREGPGKLPDHSSGQSPLLVRESS
jgi:hypothetical protein